MPKKKLVQSEVAPEVQNPVEAPVTEALPEPVPESESSSVLASVASEAAPAKKAPAKKKVVKRKAVKKSVKKVVVEAAQPVAEEAAPVVAVPEESAAEEAAVEAVPDSEVLSAEAEESELPELSAVETEIEKPVVEEKKPLLTRRNPLPTTHRQVRTEVASTTKTSVGVGLAVAGALALAAAIAVFNFKQQLGLGGAQPIAPVAEQYTAEQASVAVVEPSFTVTAVEIVRETDSMSLVGDGKTEYPIASFAIHAQDGAWTLGKFRAMVKGSEYMSGLEVRDESGAVIAATWTPVPDEKDTYDVMVDQVIPSGMSKTYTVSSMLTVKGNSVPVQVGIYSGGLLMTADTGAVVNELPADVMAAEWTVVAPAKSSKK